MMMREDWIEVELGDVLLLSSEKHKPEIIEDLFYIGLEHIEKDTGRLTIDATESTINTIKNKFYTNQILYGKLRPYLNKVYLATQSGVCSTDILVFNVSEATYSKYAFHFMLSRQFVNDMSANTSGVNLPRVSTKYINSYKFPLAPLPEQRAIAAKIEQLFSELDNGIANLKAAKSKLEIYRQAILKQAFEGKLANPKNQIQDDLPNGWTLKKINSLCEVVRGGSPRPAGDPRYYEGNIPFLKVADITRNEGIYLNTYTFTIKEAGLKNTRYVEANTLLLSNSGATLGVPKICTFPTTFNDGIAAFLGLDKDDLVYHYYFWMSKTRELRSINQGAAQPNLNTGMIGAFEIPIFSKEEQNQIVQEIETRLSVCDKLNESIDQSLEKAQALRQSILKKAFEGKLLSQDELQNCRQQPDWEPAAKLLERVKNKKSK
jgi:type I restriction enzyme S subunit